MLIPRLIHQAVLPALPTGDGSDTICNGPPPHRDHVLHARLTPPTTPITYRHARLITLRAGWKCLNQIWLMQHFSSDRRNFPGGHPSRNYSMASTLNYGVPIHMSSLKRVGQLLKDLET